MLEEYAEQMEQIGERDHDYEMSNLAAADRNFADAEDDFKSAKQQAIMACLDAILALCFFGSRILFNSVRLFRSFRAWFR